MANEGSGSKGSERAGSVIPLKREELIKILNEMDPRKTVAFLIPSGAADCDPNSNQQSVVLMACGNSERPNS